MGEPIEVTVDQDLEDLIPDFMARRRVEVAALRRDLEAGDMERLRVAGHSLKGTGGGYGFHGLSEIGADLEAAAERADVEALRRTIERMADYLERVEIRFQ